MHPTQRGLLDAIIADPADDALRLIYADWLDDNGDPGHAALTRWQVGTGTVLRYMNADWPHWRFRRKGSLEWELADPGEQHLAAADAVGRVRRSLPTRLYPDLDRGLVSAVHLDRLRDWVEPAFDDEPPPGVLAVADHPVVRVTVRDADTRPAKHVLDSGSYSWVCRDDSRPRGFLAELPADVFRLLPGVAGHRPPPGAALTCPSLEAARAELSAALLEWARVRVATFAAEGGSVRQ